MIKKTDEPNAERKEGQMLVYHVPIDIRNAFKSVCNDQGVTMSAKIIELMKVYVDKERNGTR